jgi:hypothetical protein
VGIVGDAEPLLQLPPGLLGNDTLETRVVRDEDGDIEDDDKQDSHEDMEPIDDLLD